MAPKRLEGFPTKRLYSQTVTLQTQKVAILCLKCDSLRIEPFDPEPSLEVSRNNTPKPVLAGFYIYYGDPYD